MPQDLRSNSSPIRVGSASADRMAQIQYPPSWGPSELGREIKPDAALRISTQPGLSPKSEEHGLLDRLHSLPPSSVPLGYGARTSGSSFNRLSIDNLITTDDFPQRFSNARRVSDSATDASQKLHLLDVHAPIVGHVTRKPTSYRSDEHRKDIASFMSTDPQRLIASSPTNHNQPVQIPPTTPASWLDQRPSLSSTVGFAHSPTNTTNSFHRSPHHRSSDTLSPITSPSTHLSAEQAQPSDPLPFSYSLTIRQQPIAARACGYGERDRRVIDPPPVLELQVTDTATGTLTQDFHAMLALHSELMIAPPADPSEDVGGDASTSPNHSGAGPADLRPSSRLLMGTAVASPYHAKDERGVPGTFFVFSDLSCRCAGRFRLSFRLLRIDPARMRVGSRHPTVASCESDVFAVYAAKDFPGMRASSALLKTLREQGLNVGLKKGTEARGGKRRKVRAEEEGDSGGEVLESESESDDNSDLLDAAAPSPPQPRGRKNKAGRKKTARRRRMDS